jgi:hypothetical protein
MDARVWDGVAGDMAMILPPELTALIERIASGSSLLPRNTGAWRAAD